MISLRVRSRQFRAAFRLLAAILLLMVAGTSLDSLAPTLRVGGAILVAGVLGIWWSLAAPRPARLPSAGVMIPILALLLLQSVSLTWTPFPGPAYLTLSKTILLLAILIVVMNTGQDQDDRKSWQDAVIMVALALVVIELLLFSAWWNRWREIDPGGNLLPPVGYRSSGLLLGHPNVLAGLINLALPFLLVRWWSGRAQIAHWTPLLPAGILLAGLFLTSSRAGWLSGGAGIAVTLGLIFVATRTGRQDSWRASVTRLRPWHAGLGLALLVIAGATAYWQASRTGHQPLGQSRTPVWAASVAIIQAEPWLGSGLRSYPVRFASRPDEHPEEDIPHAHNLFLQVASESGAVGLLLLVVGMAGMVLVGWMAWSAADKAGRLTLAPYGGAGAAVLTHSMADYLFGPPFYSAAVVILVGSFLGGKDIVPGVEWDASRLKRSILALVWVAAALAVLIPLRESWRGWQAALATRERDWTRAADLYCPALQDHPTNPVLASGCGLSLSQMTSERQLSPHPTDSLMALELAADLDRAWGIHAGNVGARLMAAGRYDQAGAALDQGLRVYPASGDLLLTRGLAAELSGNRNWAASYYHQALDTDPWIWYSAFMQSDPRRRQPRAFASLAPAGEADRAAWQAALHLSENDLGQARVYLNRALELNPSNLRALALSADLALLEGDPTRARQLSQLALFAGPESPVALEARAYVLYSLDPSRAERAIVAAAESLVFRSQSLRYLAAAHAQLGPVPDRAPGFIRSAISGRMALMAAWLMDTAGADSLAPRDLATLKALFDYCGCEPAMLARADELH